MYTPGVLELFKNGTAPGNLVSSDPLTFVPSVSPAGAWDAALTDILGPGTYYVEITGTGNLETRRWRFCDNVERSRALELGDDGAWFRWPRLRGVPPAQDESLDDRGVSLEHLGSKV